MSVLSKKINAILFAAIIACAPVYSSETQSTEQQDKVQTSVVWHKRRSTHIVAAVAATAIGLYALAVRKNKIAGPIALFTAIFCANKKGQEITKGDEVKVVQNQQDQNNNQEKQIVPAEQNSDNAENNTPNPVIPGNQKAVTQEVTPVDPAETTTEDNQSSTTHVPEKNVLPTTQVPVHMQAQQYAENVLGRVQDWFRAGLVDDDSLQN